MAVIIDIPMTARGEGAVTAARRSWRYAGGKRDVRLDLLRGFAAFGMIVDHLGGEHSWLYPLTGGNRFFVSAAEVFVFISGLVMGIVYTDIIARRGTGAAMRKIVKRAWTLYSLTILLTVGFAAVSWLLRVPWALDVPAHRLPLWLAGVITLHQTYFLTDIPLIYTFLVLGAAPVLLLLVRGRTRWVLAGSWALWALWQVAPDAAEIPWHIEGNTLFFVPAWQAPFVTALVIGFHRQRITAVLGRARLGVVTAVSGLLSAGVIAAYFFAPFGFSSGAATSGRLFAKANVAPGRVLVFAVLATFVFAGLTLVWTPVKRATGWLLLPLGHHALTAYSLHIFLVALLAWGAESLHGGRSLSAAATTAVQLAGVGAVWIAILLWPALAGWADSCRHCLVVHHHGTAHPLPTRLRAPFAGGGDPHDRAAPDLHDAAPGHAMPVARPVGAVAGGVGGGGGDAARHD